MLLGIDPLLVGPLLAALDGMGHGEVLVVADANFPARRGTGQVVEVPGVSAPELLAAIATVFPVDAEDPLSFMATPDGWLPLQQELLDAAGGPDAGDDRVQVLARQGFYDLAATAALVVRTGELRGYGNIALRKGVVLA